MSAKISERAFEDAIERALIGKVPKSGTSEGAGEDAGGYGKSAGYHARTPDEYDRSLCLITRDVVDFVLATQPKEWKKLKEHHGERIREKFASRVSKEIANRGALEVLRNGVKDMGCKFALAYFRPSSGLNEKLANLHAANLFAVVRQLKYSEANENSLDLCLFLNGIPIFTAELKNLLTGQNVEDAMAQYKRDRDPREPLFKYGRMLAHFAVDSDLVYVATQLNKDKTRFLPFNRGKFGGAGNPPVPPTQTGYATSYLWDEIWERDSALDLIRGFIHEVEEENAEGKKLKFIMFPRFQQLDAVRKLTAAARESGPGQRYLIQHSAGSGKSNTIAWLAHRLSTLHDDEEKRVFDSIIVITDRRILDRQLQRTVRQFEQTLGVVETIDTTSRQLKDALESGKTIIVTTLQKFPVIAEQVSELPGKRFAIIVDEAHSSQSGESSKSLNKALTTSDLAEAEKEETGAATPEEDLEDAILQEMSKRGRMPNLSTFAFTATPKPKTLELFGLKRSDGKFEPFHLYSMRQAIEEGFIMDVLANYVTYASYWRLLKKVEDDPSYEKSKASYLLKSFVDLHPHAIREKIAIMVGHFDESVKDRIGGQAKAMIVTPSRLHAVRYKLEIDKYLSEKSLPFKALVAFSGTVEDGAAGYTEPGMNGFPETQTAGNFAKSEYKFLIVANKFQTGFDQPLLHTMYVDKKLGGVNAVQTLSRLNRTHRDKRETAVLDFANEAETIKDAFEPYYEATLLSEETDPNLLYEVQGRLQDFPMFTDVEVENFARLFYNPKTKQEKLYSTLNPFRDRFTALTEEEQDDFRGCLEEYVRLYGFLSQVIPFSDVDLEKLFVFAKCLRRVLPVRPGGTLPEEIKDNIDMESYRISQTSSGGIKLDRQAGELEPQGTKGSHSGSEEELEPLSAIISALNDRFGINLRPEDRVTVDQVMQKLEADPALAASARANTRENAKLTFELKVKDFFQDIVDKNFDLYKRVTDDESFGTALIGMLFDQYLNKHRKAEELVKQEESKTLEFKSTLRWDVDNGVMDKVKITHAVLKTIAAFLNTEGGDLLIGVNDDGESLGLEHDQLENDDKYVGHLAQCIANGLGGDRITTYVDPRVQTVNGKKVCLVSCKPSSEPIYLKWKGIQKNPDGDFFVRKANGSVALKPEELSKYLKTRYPDHEAQE